MIKIHFVTRNKGKFREVETLAKQYGIIVEQLEIDKLEIQADDIRDVALYAARYIFEKIGRNKNIVVEDAGLFINALRGFPGPYSSYVCKTIGINGILKLMDNIKDRSAFFKAVVVFESPQFGEKVFEGIVHGKIALKAKGSMGFGFDPIFIPEGSTKTFAEMSIEEKNKFSHRATAFKRFFEWLHGMISKT